MAAVNKATVFVSGKLAWAKVVGDPVPNYNKDGREWTFELEPNEAGLQKFIQHGLTDRIKGRGYNIGTKGQHKDREPFLQFKKPEFRRDGEANLPIRLYDGDNVEWENGKLIGNGSTADVKLDIRDYGPGKNKGVYPIAIRVTDLVEYESSEFGGMDGGGEEPAPKKGKAKPNFNPILDDETPF